MTGKFQKGASGNPTGRPSLPVDILKAKNLNRVEFERLLNDFLNIPTEQLQVILDDKESTVLESVMASFLNKAIVQGDPNRFALILDRLIGRVKDADEAPPNPFAALSDAEKLKLAHMAVAQLEQKVGK